MLKRSFCDGKSRASRWLVHPPLLHFFVCAGRDSGNVTFIDQERRGGQQREIGSSPGGMLGLRNTFAYNSKTRWQRQAKISTNLCVKEINRIRDNVVDHETITRFISVWQG